MTGEVGTVYLLRVRKTAIAASAAALFLAGGCGTAAPRDPERAVAAVSTTHPPASADPILACGQLRDFHNNGNGISPAFSARLLQETYGTQLGTDMDAYLADVHAPVPTVGPPGSARERAATVAQIEQLIAAATAVRSDCNAYGITGVFHGL
jgi:hypothetical protein